MTSSPTDTGRRPWTGAVIGSLLVLALAFIAIITLSGTVIPPLMAFAVIFLVLAGAIRRRSENPWLLVLAALLAGVALIMSVPFFAEDLAHPDTFFSFFPAVVGTVAAIIAVAAGLLGATRRWASAIVIVASAGAAVVAVAFVISLAVTVSIEDDARTSGDVVIVAQDSKFRLGTVALRAGGTGIFIENKDRIRHTFVIEGTEVKRERPGSIDRRVEVDLPVGTYRFYCDVPGHEKMEGVLEVS